MDVLPAKPVPEDSLFRASSFGLASRSLALAVTVATHLWLAREIGPSGYGGFVLALVIQGAVALASNLGLGSALSYYIAQEPGRSRQIVWSGFIASTFIATPLLPLAWLFLVASDAPLFPGLHPGWVAVALVTVPLRLLQEDLAGVCVGLGRLGRMFAQNALAPLMLLAALAAGRAAGNLDQATVAAAWLVANVGSACAALILTLPLLSSRGAPGWTGDFRFALRLVSLGGQQTLNLAAWWLLARISRAIVGVVAGTDGAGRFAISASIAEVVTQIPSVIQVSLFSRVARAEAEHSAGDVQRVTRVAVLIVAVASVAATIAGAWLIDGYLGPAYRDSIATLVALAPGIIALTPVTIIGVYFVARLGQPAVNLVPTVAALVALVPGAWILGERWGIFGAAVGTTLGYAVAGAAAVALFSRRSGLGWTSTVLPTAGDVRLVVDRLTGRGSPHQSP